MASVYEHVVSEAQSPEGSRWEDGPGEVRPHLVATYNDTKEGLRDADKWRSNYRASTEAAYVIGFNDDTTFKGPASGVLRRKIEPYLGQQPWGQARTLHIALNNDVNVFWLQMGSGIVFLRLTAAEYVALQLLRETPEWWVE